jgi:thymidylate synthase ThyX
MGDKSDVMKNFSLEDEETLRSFIFTNPHGNVSFIYPQELIAGEEMSPLMSAVSRTHVGLQERMLTFLDQEKQDQVKAMLPYIKPLMDIFRLPDGALKVSPKTANFNKEWVLAHGHGTIKEETQLYGYSENHSDITGKHLSGHPLSKPQAKSTRYISYGNVLDLSLQDKDLLNLGNIDSNLGSDVLTYVKFMNDKYLDFTNRLSESVYNHPDTSAMREFLARPDMVDTEIAKIVTKRKERDSAFEADETFIKSEAVKYLKSIQDPDQVKKALDKFVIDYSRVYLVAATRTSAVFSMDARTIEEVITGMLSSPRIEDKVRGQELWDEAKKVAPILLGEKGHVGADQWKVWNEAELRPYIEARFSHITSKTPFDGRHVVKVITPQDMEMYTDKFNAASIVFQYTDASLEDIMPALSDKDVKDVLHKAHKARGKYDIIHPGISHGGMMVEMLMGYHGYRDIFRHRRGSRTNQLLTTRHGFEVPEIFRTFDMSKEYIKDMMYASEIFEKVREVSPHVAEKVVPFGALVQALHSWQVNQIGYVGALRSVYATGNLSYVYMARDMIEQVKAKMPITGEFFKYDTSDYPTHLWKRGLNWYDATKNVK